MYRGVFEEVRRNAEIAANNKLCRIRYHGHIDKECESSELEFSGAVELAAMGIRECRLSNADRDMPNRYVGGTCCSERIYSLDNGMVRRGRVPPEDDADGHGFCGRCIAN